jgi:hypothetical protein
MVLCYYDPDIMFSRSQYHEGRVMFFVRNITFSYSQRILITLTLSFPQYHVFIITLLFNHGQDIMLLYLDHSIILKWSQYYFNMFRVIIALCTLSSQYGTSVIMIKLSCWHHVSMISVLCNHDHILCQEPASRGSKPFWWRPVRHVLSPGPAAWSCIIQS